MMQCRFLSLNTANAWEGESSDLDEVRRAAFNDPDCYGFAAEISGSEHLYYFGEVLTLAEVSRQRALKPEEERYFFESCKESGISHFVYLRCGNYGPLNSNNSTLAVYDAETGSRILWPAPHPGAAPPVAPAP